MNETLPFANSFYFIQTKGKTTFHFQEGKCKDNLIVTISWKIMSR